MEDPWLGLPPILQPESGLPFGKHIVAVWRGRILMLRSPKDWRICSLQRVRLKTLWNETAISQSVSGLKVGVLSFWFLDFLADLNLDPHLLSVGQLQWLDYDLLLPALRPMFLFHGLTENQVRSLITGAQRDLYHPVAELSTHINIVHASKHL